MHQLALVNDNTSLNLLGVIAFKMLLIFDNCEHYLPGAG